MSSVRDRIRVIERALLSGDLQPAAAREYLQVATALMGLVNREVTEADLQYNAVLAECYGREETANRAKLMAENTEQYRRKRQAKDEQALCEEMIRTLKAVMKSLDEEMRLAK